jgi:hypothetical protein
MTEPSKAIRQPPPQRSATPNPIIHSEIHADNQAGAQDLLYMRCTDERNHRTQAPPAKPEGIDFLRPNHAGLGHGTQSSSSYSPSASLREQHADWRAAPAADVTSRAPRKRRGTSVVKCLRACLGVKGNRARRATRPISAMSRGARCHGRRCSVTGELVRTARVARPNPGSVPKVPPRGLRARNVRGFGYVTLVTITHSAIFVSPIPSVRTLLQRP